MTSCKRITAILLALVMFVTPVTQTAVVYAGFMDVLSTVGTVFTAVNGVITFAGHIYDAVDCAIDAEDGEGAAQFFVGLLGKKEDQKLNGIETTVKEIDGKIDNITESIDVMDEKLDGIMNSLNELHAKLGSDVDKITVTLYQNQLQMQDWTSTYSQIQTFYNTYSNVRTTLETLIKDINGRSQDYDTFMELVAADQNYAQIMDAVEKLDISCSNYETLTEAEKTYLNTEFQLKGKTYTVYKYVKDYADFNRTTLNNIYNQFGSDYSVNMYTSLQNMAASILGEKWQGGNTGIGEVYYKLAVMGSENSEKARESYKEFTANVQYDFLLTAYVCTLSLKSQIGYLVQNNGNLNEITTLRGYLNSIDELVGRVLVYSDYEYQKCIQKYDFDGFVPAAGLTYDDYIVYYANPINKIDNLTKSVFISKEAASINGSIQISNQNIYLGAGESEQLKIWYNGEEVQQNYTLTSDNDCVIVNVDGTVVGVRPGSATISITEGSTTKAVASVTVGSYYAKYDGSGTNQYNYYKDGVFKTLSCSGEGYTYEYCADISALETAIDSSASKSAALSDVVPFDGTTIEDYDVFLNHPYGKMMNGDSDNLLFSHAYTGTAGLIRTVDGRQSVVMVPITNEAGDNVNLSEVTYTSNHSNEGGILYIYDKEDLLNWKSTYDNSRKTEKVNVVLMNDIDMEWEEWTGITQALHTRGPNNYECEYDADLTFEHKEYTFDGNGHTIKNITFVPTKTKIYTLMISAWEGIRQRDSLDVVTYGFFAKLTGTVKNLTIENVKYSDNTTPELDASWPRIYSVFTALSESQFQYVKKEDPNITSIPLKAEILNCVAKGTSSINTNNTIYYDPFGNLLDYAFAKSTGGTYTFTFEDDTEGATGGGFNFKSNQGAVIQNCVFDMELDIDAGKDSRISMFNYTQQAATVYANLYAGEITMNGGADTAVEFINGLENEQQRNDAKDKIRVADGSNFCNQDLSAYTLSKSERFDASFWTSRGWNSAGVSHMLNKNGYPVYFNDFTVDISNIKGTYFTGESFDKENIAVYGADGKKITDYSVMVSGDTSTAGEKTVIVKYEKADGTIISGSFVITYVEHVPVTFAYDNQTTKRYAEKGGTFTFPGELFTRDDGYLQNGWYKQGTEIGTPIGLGGTAVISQAAVYVPAWREGADCQVVFGNETMTVKEGQVITVPAFNGYDINLFTATGWYCKDAEPSVLQPGDQLKVTKNLTFIVQTEDRYTTLKVKVLFQNLDDEEYLDLGFAVFDQARHGENVSEYYADAFAQLAEKYADEDRSWIEDCIAGVTAENCLEEENQYLVQADADSTVTIKVNRPTFEVTWKDIEGEIIQTDSLRYGATPAAPEDKKCVSPGYIPVWNKDFEPVTEDTAYQVTAETPSPYTSYTINHYWQNVEDDEYVLQESENMRGTTGEETAAESKTYNGFTAKAFSQNTISGDGTTNINIYYDRNLYTVSWNIEGTVTPEEYRYGAVPEWKGEEPQKPADVQYSYTFETWGDMELVTDHVTYTAVFGKTLNKYGITWDIDGKTWTEYYDYGETPSYKGKTPERDADVQYTYTFAGWGEITTVNGAKTYTAVFDETLNKYTITWNVDGVEIDEVYEYGATPVYKGVDPVKLSDAAYTYAFNGWGQMEPVAGDKTYTAQFVSTTNKYTVTWKIGDAETTELYAYGETPVYKGVTPEKPATAQYSYTFAGWGDIDEVTGNKTYTASFDKTVNEYTITWNVDGRQTTEVYKYGEIPSYKGETPERPADAQYTYKFKDWGNITKVTGDKTYTAAFDSKVNKYSITWIIDGQQLTEIYEYGEIPFYKGVEPKKQADDANTYAFNGWGQMEPVTGNKAYTAIFVSTANKYAVTWDIDGQKQIELYTYGDMPSYKGTEPVKESDAQYVYTFAGWGIIESVTGDKTYTAGFDTVPVTYNITWNIDGVETTEIYYYGDTPKYKGDVPARAEDVQYLYTFKDWGDITTVNADKTYTANFNAEVKQYEITWVVNGEMVTETYNYGDVPMYKGVTPKKDVDTANTYAFNGWGQMEPVTEDKTYQAEFVSTVNKYQITWEVEGQTMSEWYAYGETPVYKGIEPTKPADPQYTYSFVGWGDIKTVKGDETYKAQFNRDLNEYIVTWNVDGKMTTEVYKYGDIPVYKGAAPTKEPEEHYSYSFENWGDIQIVTNDVTYDAVFKAVVCKIASCKLSFNKTVYNGREQKPEIISYDVLGNQLVEGKDYTVSFDEPCKNVGRYKVIVNYCGVYHGQNIMYFTITPKASKTVSAKLYGYDDVKISWDKAEGATGYYVYYKKSTAKKYTLIRRTTGTSIKQADLADGAKYTFKVVPFYKSGNTRYVSNDAKTATVQTLKKVAKPKVVTIGAKVKVKWKGIDGETGYQISMSQRTNGTNVVATKNAKLGAYKLLKAERGKTYYYKVRAYKVVDGKKVFGPWSKSVAYKR